MKRLLLTLILSSVSCCAMAFDLASLSQQLQAVKTVQGEFTQNRYLRTLPKPIKATGRFVLIPNQGLLWRLETPIEVTMRVRQQGIEQLNERQQWILAAQSAAGQSRQVKLFLDLLAGQTEGLQQQFEIELRGNAQAWQMRLTPKSVLMTQIFNHIDVAGGQVVQRIRLDETQGDQTELVFNAIKLNAELSTFEYQAFLP